MNNIQPIKAASCAASLLQFDPTATIIRMPELVAITGLAFGYADEIVAFLKENSAV